MKQIGAEKKTSVCYNLFCSRRSCLIQTTQSMYRIACGEQDRARTQALALLFPAPARDLKVNPLAGYV